MSDQTNNTSQHIRSNNQIRVNMSDQPTIQFKSKSQIQQTNTSQYVRSDQQYNSKTSDQIQVNMSDQPSKNPPTNSQAGMI